MKGSDTEQVMVFESGGQSFGLELDRVDSVLEKTSIFPVPGTTPVSKGLIFYRNGILPVIDLFELLSVPVKGDKEGFFVVVQGVSEDFCITASSITGVATVEQLELQYSWSDAEGKSYIKGSGRFREKEFSLLDFKDL